MRVQTPYAYTVTTTCNRAGADPWRVVVNQGSGDPIVEMSALSRDHARQVAESLAILLPILRPGSGVIVAQA